MRGSELEERLTDVVAERSSALGAARDALKDAQQRHFELQARLRTALQSIAEQRLAAADRAEPLQALGTVDAMLGEVAIQRARALDELRAKRVQATAQLERDEKEEMRAAEIASASRTNAEKLRAQALARFEATTSFARLNQAVEVAAAAGQQVEEALQVARRNLSEFDAAVVHPVHLYLRERRYATPDYGASIIGSALDAFAARVSRYPEVYLREQLLVGAVQAAVEQAQAAASRHALAEQELAAAVDAFVDQDKAGPALARADADESALAQRKAATDAQRATVRRLDDSIAAHAAGQDVAARQAREQVVEVLLNTSAQVRAAAVGETTAPMDDLAAAEAAELEAKLRALAQETQELSAKASAVVETLDGVEALLKLTRDRGWTSSRSRFRRLDLDALLASMLISREAFAEASRSLERAHYVEEPPARPPSSWSGGGGWGSGGGFGGGSRATGGGFGGGGRRTGGGF